MINEEQYMQELEKLVNDNPETKQVYDLISDMLGGNDELTEVSVVEIDGTDYYIIKEFTVKGTTYAHLVSENDPLDFMYKKVIIEDDEEYLVELDSDEEFELVVAYEQKYIWRDVKRAQELESKSDNEG